MNDKRLIINQFVKFGLVGLSNTAVSLLVYYAFILIDVRLYIIGSIAGFLVSVLNSYFWNNRYVFRADGRNHVRALGKTYLSYGLTALLSTGMIVLLVEGLQVAEWLAPLICLIVTVPLNFLMNKFWAFK